MPPWDRYAQQGASQPAQQPVQTGAPAYPDIIPGRPAAPPAPPSGYEMGPSGSLRPIPGGPADPNRQQPQQPPSGYRPSANGGLEPIPGGPADPSSSQSATEAERTAGFLAGRIVDSVTRLSQGVQNDANAAGPSVGTEAIRGIFGDTAANYATDSNRQQVRAAQLDIIDAALTLGTGAAYTPDQLENYRTTYFPQLGDTPETIASKRAALRSLIVNAQTKAGRSAPDIQRALDAIDAMDGTPPTRQEPLSAGGTAVSANDPSAPGGSGPSGGLPSDPDPNGGVDEYGTPRRLLNGEVLQGYQRSESGTLFPQYGAPEPTRTGIAATILGDGTRSIGEQLGAGVGDIAQGMGDVLGMVGNPVNRGINAALGTNLSTDLGQTARDLSGLPSNPNELQSVINRSATAAMTFGGAARAAAPLMENATARGVLNTLGQSPVRDAVAGGSAGAGAYAARDYGPAGQFVAALGAGALGYGAAGLIPGARAAAAVPATRAGQVAANDVVAAGRREGVRVMTSDVRPPRTPIGNAARGVGERIPFAGTGGSRVAQQAEREAAVRNVAQDFGVTGTDDFISAVTRDLVRTRGSRLTRLTDRKNQIIDSIAAPMQAPRTVAAIDAGIARLNGVNQQAMAPVVRQLENFRQVLSNGPTLRQVEENRRLLGDMFSDPNLANVRGLGEKAVSAVYGPLREDMVDFVRTEAGDQAAQSLQETNDRLAAMVGELDSARFRNVLRSAETTPESVANLLFSRNESDVRRLVENLSASGRQKAQSAIIYRALESAGDLNAVAGLSPQRFANQIERYSANIGVVFDPRDVQRLQGLQRLLQATQRASEASANPPTGVQNAVPILAAVLTDLMGGVGSAMTTGTMGGLLARLYESAPVRDRLLGLARSERGSAGEGRMLDSIARIMASQPAFREAFAGVANDNPALPANVAASPQDQQNR